MNNITLLAIDIAKNIFQLHGRTASGKTMCTKRLKRKELLAFVAHLAPCTIVMEACSGANHWGRQFKQYGHEVKLISPQHVVPYRKGQKNDKNDAEAIAEAASRPNAVFVPLKAVEHQDIQTLHRMRQLVLKQQTMLANHIRGLLSEYGIIVPKGIHNLRKQLVESLADQGNELTEMIRQEFHKLYENLLEFADKLAQYDTQIKEIALMIPICQSLLKLRGVGPMTASIIYADLGEAKAYKNGRSYAANLGLVPRQHSSGDKQRLMGITKCGDSYIRQLLIHGARSVLAHLEKKTDQLSEWLKKRHERGGVNVAAVALANKNARVMWAIISKQVEYDSNLIVAGV